ncbi:hypothetical protein [Streptomyces violascens]|uniref:Uncharacterized protein n=1 Tax=Streptomyces violascens TaxID=67381 RepID=A0ABQ3QWL8_9ACTN|nr:hypothetical protein [Streptomyces violascens]GGU11729.1 hypothetical protein GCM10010289_36300 [Streptomyces violascens]GHI41681.1 hypothetical protein Sviol_60890 [Streptomyces violascens]
MSEPEAIVPSGIPQFTGDLDSLDRDTALLSTEAGAFRDSGAGIHSNFQGVAAFYKAPEADQLFATTAPVAAKTASFAGQLEKVSGALSAYSQEVRPLAKKLEDLQRQAFAFTASIEGDDHWRRDEKKRDRNDGLKDEVQATLQAFYEAEIACHNKITALVGGSTLVLGKLSGGQMLPKGTSAYGAGADDLNHLDNAPWGNYAEPEYTGLSWLYHQGKSFVWDGFIVDGIWGTVKGIDILLGCNGSDAAGEAWKGLAKVVTGLAIAITPGAGAVFTAAPDSMMPAWFRDSRTALKETGKALIAYDEWGKNPSRAAGGVTFNVLTTVFTGGAGAAAKGGAVAKTVSVLGKVGRVVDPMTYVFEAGKFGVVKVGDLFATLKTLNSGAYNDILSGAGHLQPDGTYVKFSDGVPVVKGDVIEWPNGSRLDLKEGTVTLADGTKSAARIELSVADRAALENALPRHEPAMAGGRPGDSAADLVGGHSRSAPNGTGSHASSGAVRAHGQGSSLGSDTSSASRGPVVSHGGDAGHTNGPVSHDSGHGTNDAGSGVPDGIHHPDGAHGNERPHSGDTSSDGAPRELTGPEVKAIQDELVRKANEDSSWLHAHYYEYTEGVFYRKDKDFLVDGAPLPVLKTLPDGSFISKSDMPVAPGAIKVDREIYGIDTAPKHALPDLHKITADRNAAHVVEMAQRAVRDSKSPANLAALEDALAAFREQVSDNPRPPNSKVAEEMGELAARLHIMPTVYPDAIPVKLMETGNGANRLDSLYEYMRGNEVHYVVVEEKGPGADLGWREGKADPPDLSNPKAGDNGGAEGLMVEQGTRKYLRTIFGKMVLRGEDVLAGKLRTALEEGRLEYIQVKANMPNGDNYAGATKWRFVT